MSQIDLQKLTKKNQEFVHIATQQFIKDGKQTLKSRLFLRKLFPKSLRASQGYDCSFPSMAHRPIGLIVSLSRNNMKKSIQKKMMIQNS